MHVLTRTASCSPGFVARAQISPLSGPACMLGQLLLILTMNIPRTLAWQSTVCTAYLKYFALKCETY